MKWNNLSSVAHKNRQRVGRGIGSGAGKTSGRGTKGQGSRSGGNVRPGFEGGQNPLHMRLPKKRGFSSKRPATQEVHTDQLNGLKAGSTVDVKSLKTAGIVGRGDLPVRLLNRGDIEVKLTVKLQGATQNAIANIVKAGGTFSITKLPKVREAKPKAKSS